jgi:hypothetical protein
VLPVPTTADLEIFTGRPAATFGGFADQALAQATLMLTLVTKLTELPDDPDLAQLANNAIMELADRILLEQPFQAINAGPFQTETIGSYSYSRVTATTTKVQQGIKTGLLWWDLAVDRLSVLGSSYLGFGGIDEIPEGLVRNTDTGLWNIRNAAEDDDNGGMPYVRIS